MQGLQQIFIKLFLTDVIFYYFLYYKIFYVNKTQTVFFDNFILEFQILKNMDTMKVIFKWIYLHIMLIFFFFFYVHFLLFFWLNKF